jgi:signal peptidase II
MKYFRYYLLALAIIAIDQAVKLAVHANMEMGMMGEVPVFGDWFKLHYTTNPGMAFGLEFGSEYGKLGLTLFRLLAMSGIAYFLYTAARKEIHAQGFLWSVALILGGAIGNVVDSTFYGFFLDNAPFTETPPPFYPWFHGQVIDMFYLDIWEGRIPDDIPLIGGNYYSLWPIFNVADASIFVGVAIILIFQRRFFPIKHDEKRAETVSEISTNLDDQNPSMEVSDKPVTN